MFPMVMNTEFEKIHTYVNMYNKEREKMKEMNVLRKYLKMCERKHSCRRVGFVLKKYR